MKNPAIIGINIYDKIKFSIIFSKMDKHNLTKQRNNYFKKPGGVFIKLFDKIILLEKKRLIERENEQYIIGKIFKSFYNALFKNKMQIFLC